MQHLSIVGFGLLGLCLCLPGEGLEGLFGFAARGSGLKCTTGD